ncbi:hypothetical protein GCM10023194_03700 [Planotetraspora phitsanulokensis]|uniref:Secreted protein n=1 Tax=Planotetraspora phitsanulokensis TaxID=575192 RepID=A0A8J3XH29_9ACTN|nr:DUF5719 family protein [Planotetraspora phitsanulokensis]GII40774.1 hypothetical protein Pph01_57770 [Planotetraspora phitsanulokensis]
MKSLIENRFGLLVLVLVALGALYGVAYASRPAPVAHTPSKPVRALMESLTTVCPSPGGSRVSVVTPPGAQGKGSATVGEVTRAPAADEDASGADASGGDASGGDAANKDAQKKGAPKKGAADEPTRLEQPGVLWQQDVKAGTAPLVVAGAGSMAAGLEAAQTARLDAGTQRGLASVRCAEPGSDAWFVGPGPAAAAMTLYLTNADSAPANVEVMIYAGEGPVLSDRGSGMVLQPGEHRTVKLSDLAPSPLVMAVEVSTSGGRVAAAIKAVLGKDKGVDWLPAAAPPATQVVVPGIPGMAGLRELYVTAPGEQDTVVQVKAVLKDGSYALKNKETVDVLAGSTSTFDLSTGIGGQPAALVLTSDVPIIAGMKITGTGLSQDVAFAAGASPIDLGSVVADNRVARKQESRLVLSAPFAAATLKLQLVPKRGAAPEPVEVKVPAARTKEIKLAAPPGGESGFSVVLQPQPGSGPVYGGRALVEDTPGGQLVTVQPLAPATIWALVPPTADSPSAVLP